MITDQLKATTLSNSELYNGKTKIIHTIKIRFSKIGEKADVTK